MYQLNKKASQLTQKLQREPTTQELADAMDIKTKEVETLRQVSGDNLSLSESIDGESDFQLLDKLVQDTESGADEQLLQEAFESQVREILKKLDEKEATIIKYRFGLDGGDPKTLKEIGELLNLSRERIRQIENIALRKLRRHSAIQDLKGFLS